MMKIFLAAVLFVSATEVSLAQSAYTTGTLASSEGAGYPDPSTYGNHLYAYAPDYGRGRPMGITGTRPFKKPIDVISHSDGGISDAAHRI
jgi:hypothetical protein